jgi:hypothetical protein
MVAHTHTSIDYHTHKHEYTHTHTHQNAEDFIRLLVIHRNPVHFPQFVAYTDQTWNRDKTRESERDPYLCLAIFPFVTICTLL